MTCITWTQGYANADWCIIRMETGENKTSPENKIQPTNSSARFISAQNKHCLVPLRSMRNAKLLPTPPPAGFALISRPTTHVPSATVLSPRYEPAITHAAVQSDSSLSTILYAIALPYLFYPLYRLHYSYRVVKIEMLFLYLLRLWQANYEHN